MKNYDKNRRLSYLKYFDVNNLFGWPMSQKLPDYGFEWVEGTCQCNKDFIKIDNEGSDIGYFLEVEVQYHEKLHDL